jgi:Fic family protein
LRAIQAHYDIVTIHPFIDGNGRTARLFMNMILLLDGFPLMTIMVRDREQYLSVLEQAQTQGTYHIYEQRMLERVKISLEHLLQSS